ncbi:OLC1v1026021C1 [Oldenlandia corymbosa var. corymbosa]|uniref:OLC1v1026021C1 n=1 Tax=Oldenlandia corymbosa var. corymbosa TaxID=529605 RepID=A0AAV1C633_OLDCO|nr:OLC1v1026021C1 [Oldenlandia corymbosa var. corymbosa]
MSFTETVHLKVYWNTTYTTELGGTITVQRHAPDGYLIIDRMLDFSELVDKVCGVMEVDREELYIDFSLARCGSLDHDAVECPFSHPPADRTAIDKLYDPCGICGHHTMPEGGWAAYLERMFGFRFQTEESRLTSVSITEIKTHIENNPLMDQSPDEAHLQQVRCCVGWLVGGLLFSNTTRNSFPLDLVHFLHTPEIFSEYSWGSATLCYLYRSMSKSSLAASAKAITGCVILLQLWAWERILTVQPKILGGELDLSHCPLGMRLVGTDDDYVGEPTADPEYLLWYHQVTVKYVTDLTDSENARGFHGSAETFRLMATLMEDIRSLSIIGQRTFDKDSFGYNGLGEIAQVAERALSVNATNVQSSLDGQSIHYTSNFFSSMFEGVASQHQADDPAGGERESQGEYEDEDEVEDADPHDQFEGQGYQRHEEQGSSQTLRTPPLAVSKGQRVTKEPDRLTYSHFRAKKPKKK